MAEKEVKYKLGLEDEFSDSAKEAASAGDKLDDTLENVEKSSMEANIAFLATVEAIDKVGGSAAKIRGGLEDLGLVTEEQADALRKVEGAADLFTGTATLAVVGMQAWTKATIAQRNALIGLGAAAGAAGLAVAAMSAESEEMRALYSVLTGITSGLAIAQFTLALANYSAAVAAAGPAAPVMAAIIGGSLIAAGTYWAATKAQAGLQTGEGQVKEFEVEAAGMVEVHPGERGRITRRGATPAILGPARGPEMGLGRQINITLIGAYDPLNPSGQRRIAEAVGRLIVGDERGLKA